MNGLFEKLEKVAETIDREKPTLNFFGLVHERDALDRWVLLVAADPLQPWSMEAIKYVADLLKKKLRPEEIVRIARIVALPADNGIVKSLAHNDQVRLGKLSTLQDDRFDRVFVFRSTEQLQKAS